MKRFIIVSLLLGLLSVQQSSIFVLSEPHSKPYIPFHTDPKDHPFVKHIISWDDDRSNSRRVQVKQHNDAGASNKQCPLHFTLGVSRRAHNKAQNSPAFGIVTPPVIHPIFPARGPGRQVLHNTLYEHMDLLSPEIAGPDTGGASSIIKEGLIQHQEYPLLFESSSFAYSSPIVHDVNGDGIPDAILADYDGGIYIIGLHEGKKGKRWFQKDQVPRIYIRREWVEARVNETYKAMHPEEKEQTEENPEGVTRDPYHSYFEYSHSDYGQNDVLRGVTANVLGQKRDDLDALKKRRSQKRGPVKRESGESIESQSLESESVESESVDESAPHVTPDVEVERRRLLAVDEEDGDEVIVFPRRRLQEVDPQEQQQEEDQRRWEQEQQPRQEEEQRRREDDEQRRREEEEQQRRREEEQRKLEEEEQRRREEQERNQQQERERQEQADRERQEQQRNEEKQREQQAEQGSSGQQLREEQEKRSQQDRERTEAAERERQVERERQEQAGRERQQQDEVKAREESEPISQEQGQREEKQHLQQQQQQRQGEQNLQGQQRQDPPEKRQKEPSAEDHSVGSPSREDHSAGSPSREDHSAGSPSREDHSAGDPSAEGPSRGEISRGRDSSSDSHSNSVSREDDEFPSMPSRDDEYPNYGYGDDMYRGGYDDYYGRYRSYRDDYYDESSYIRVNPHILTTPTLAEIPKLYGGDAEVEDVLFVPVSYFLDEDEYEGHLSYRRFENTDEGDETEVQRGTYVASAIMIYQLGEGSRWGRQEHLDLSTDFSSPQNATLLGRIPVSPDNTKMGAFALSRPAVADIDGDGKMEILVGTSMGIVYAFDATHMTMKNNWPIQMQHPVESPIVVEDVAANTKLETFVSDIGGNVACFDEDANKVWHRDLRAAVSNGPSTVRASSPMTLGDVDGDGVLDVVLTLQVFLEENQREATYIFALNAVDGKDLENFPVSFETPASRRSTPGEDWVHQQLPGSLIIDLHSDQSHILDYIRRNGTKWERRIRSTSNPGGGTAPGLHIVVPIGEKLYIIEAGGSRCTQSFDVGEDMVAMVQADDVHGTNSLDLVVSTVSGNVITMESSSPYHPLNVWNNGQMRGRMNTYAHGYSASQGIFVHEVSRQYRDIFGVFVPVTFEIFDNRPNIAYEPDMRIYKVEIRDGTSTKRAMWRNTYNSTGVYTERLYIPHGAGYYSLMVQMRGSNGLVYEDMFHIGYNVNYMDGFGLMLWLPLLLAAITIFLGSSRNIRWDDEDYENPDRNGGGLGILG